MICNAKVMIVHRQKGMPNKAGPGQIAMTKNIKSSNAGSHP